MTPSRSVDPRSADVLVVGGGIMGSTVARLVREADPAVRILMVDAGAVIGDTPGLHLHDVPDPELWERYNERVASGIQGMYTGGGAEHPDQELAGDVARLGPGMFRAGRVRRGRRGDARARPSRGTRVAWVCTGRPRRHGPPAQRCSTAAIRRAGPPTCAQRNGCWVCIPAPSAPPNPAGWCSTCCASTSPASGSPDRAPQPMPMAVAPVAEGLNARTGPSVIFPPIASGGDDRLRAAHRRPRDQPAGRRRPGAGRARPAGRRRGGAGAARRHRGGVRGRAAHAAAALRLGDQAVGARALPERARVRHRARPHGRRPVRARPRHAAAAAGGGVLHRLALDAAERARTSRSTGRS